jgi:hypothetical protein
MYRYYEICRRLELIAWTSRDDKKVVLVDYNTIVLCDVV